MTTNSNKLAIYQAALDTLLQESPSAEHRADYDAVTSALLRWISRKGVSHVMAAETGDYRVQLHAPIVDTERSKYEDMSVAEAVFAYLSALPTKEDKQLKELVKALEAEGFEFETENPSGSMNVALKRRSRSYADVMITGRGRWGLRDWYTKKELAAFAHKERTRAGMEAAKARGVQIGKTWKINESQAIEFKRLIESNAKVSHICEVFGISVTAVRNYKIRLADWEPGDPFPPTKEDKKDDDESSSGSQMRLVT